MQRWIAGLGLVIGVVTGLGTIIGWIASASLKDTLITVLPIAGYVNLVVFAGSILTLLTLVFGDRVRRLAGRVPDFRWTSGWIFALAAAILVPFVGVVAFLFATESWWEAERDHVLALFGVLGVMVGVALGLQFLWIRKETPVQALRGECPWCKSEIPLEAAVCRYCGRETSTGPDD